MRQNKISWVPGAVSTLAAVLTLGAGGPARATVLLSDNFNDNSINPAKWLADTTAAGSSVVAQDQHIAITGRGNLMTVNQYDPEAQVDPISGVHGLMVSGQWTLGPGTMSDIEWLGVYTRSSSTVTGGGSPFGGLGFMILAFNGGYGEIRIMDFGVSTLVGGNQGMAVSGILGNFAEGNTYNFTAVDRGTDGLSFTVANAANPTVTATITGMLSADNGTAGYVDFNNANGAHVSYLDNVTISTVVPEPATVTLLALGGLLLRWRRQRSQ